MRIEGDVGACRAVVRELERGAVTVQVAQEQISVAQTPMAMWEGAAADLWRMRAGRGSADLDGAARSMQDVARALAAFADDLAHLQARARSLIAEAAAHRLHLDEAGWIPPVVVSADPELAGDGLRRQAVRGALLEHVERLRAEEDALHIGLAKELGAPTPAEPSSGTRSIWSLGVRDAPSGVLAAAGVVYQQSPNPGVRLVGGVARSNVLGAGVTLATELAAGEGAGDALVTAGATGAGAAVLSLGAVAVLGAAAAPVAVPAGMAVAVGVGAGLLGSYVAGRLVGALRQDRGRPVGRTSGRDARPFVDGPRRRGPARR